MPGSGCRAPPYGDAVRTRPGDLSDAELAAALREGWDLEISALAYAAVGFGSYHWRARAAGASWFVTADDLELKRSERSEPLDAPRRRLVTALSTARALHDAGLDFVVAPVMTPARTVVHVVGGRFAVALTPMWSASSTRGGRTRHGGSASRCSIASSRSMPRRVRHAEPRSTTTS